MNLRCFSAFYLSAVAFLPSAVVGESQACVNDPVDWVSGSVYDCAYLEAQPENCLALGEGTDGKTATEACCACGGGIEPENPKQCNDEPRWYLLNSNGVEKDCDWFADDADYRCEKHGDKEGRFSMSANEACCACGGGDQPVTSPPVDPPKQCDDEEDWYFLNNNGVEKDCGWFANDADYRCEKHGHKEGRFGLSANEACCACGGGNEPPKVCLDEEDWFILNNNGKEKDCDWFADDPDYRCERHGHKEGEFDLSADQACCACGGGDLPRQCTDETIGDDEDWFVSHHNGKDYDCDWFAKDPDSRCAQHGNRVGEEDMTADQACCACGGGSDGPKLCDSESGWFVTNQGKEYDCEWFGKKDERCDKHGNRRGEFGLTAEEACCECGGGSTIG